MKNDLCLCLSSPYLIKFMWLHYYFMRFGTFAILVDDDTHGVDLRQVPVEQKQLDAIHNLHYYNIQNTEYFTHPIMGNCSVNSHTKTHNSNNKQPKIQPYNV